MKELEESVYKLQIPSDVKICILKYIETKDVSLVQKLRAKIVYGVFNSDFALAMSNTEKHDTLSWYNLMLDKLEPSISSFEVADQDKIISIILREHTEREPKAESVELFNNVMSLIKNR